MTEIRTADHLGFGRVVINTNGKANYKIEQDGDHVIVLVTGDVALAGAPAAPRNISAMKSNGSTLDLVLTHGAQMRTSRVNGHIVLDVLDVTPPAAKAHRDEVQPAPRIIPPRQVPLPPPMPPLPKVESAPQSLAPPPLDRPDAMAKSAELGGRSAVSPPEPPVPMTAERPPVVANPLASPTVSEPATPLTAIPLPAGSPSAVASTTPTETPPPTGVASGVEAVQPTPPGRDVLPENEGPIVLRARRTRLPKDMDGTGFIVPFDSTTAAAAFEEDDGTVIVFDERRPVDLAGLAKDPLFASATVRLLPTGTLFRVPHPSNLSIVLTQLPQGWRVAALTTRPKLQPIVASGMDKRLNLAADQPGDVVNLADPITGATLLVGTQHRSGQGVVSSRRSTEFILRPSSQGVVVEALSDVLSLKQIPTGFSLSGAPSGLAISPTTMVTPVLLDAAHLTRRLNLSTMPTDALFRLAVKQIGDAAKAPPLARGPRHRIAAESFLSLGLATEAESLLQMAAEQDPKEAASADTSELTGVAALLAGRTDEARALTDPRAEGTDEAALWRALFQATRDEGSAGAASVFATTGPLAFQYPEAIRKRILPLIIETMIQGGELTGAARLLEQRKDDTGLAYARAIMSQAQGKNTEALAQLDAIANGHDQFDRARAAVRAVELRLTTGELDTPHAADALDNE